MQKMVSYDYRKSFYISGHIPGTIRGSKVRYYIELFLSLLSQICLFNTRHVFRFTRSSEPTFWGTKRGAVQLELILIIIMIREMV